MKVRMTFEVDFDDRLVIGIAENNEFKPASREDCVAFFERMYDNVLTPGRVKLQEFYQAISLDLIDAPKKEK